MTIKDAYEAGWNDATATMVATLERIGGLCAHYAAGLREEAARRGETIEFRGADALLKEQRDG